MIINLPILHPISYENIEERCRNVRGGTVNLSEAIRNRHAVDVLMICLK